MPVALLLNVLQLVLHFLPTESEKAPTLRREAKDSEGSTQMSGWLSAVERPVDAEGLFTRQ